MFEVFFVSLCGLNKFFVEVVLLQVGLVKQSELGGGFKYSLCSPLFGEDSHFW